MAEKRVSYRIREAVSRTENAVRSWADQTTTAAQEAAAAHEAASAAARRRLDDQRRKYEELDDLNNQQQRAAAAAARRVASQRRALGKLRCAFDAEPTQARNREIQLASLQRQLEEERSALHDAVNSRVGRVDQLSGAVLRAKKLLGLDIRVRDNHLEFAFTSIDERQPQREFTLALRVDSSTDAYSLAPSHKGMLSFASLIDQLNRDNDLSRFIQCIRREFIAQVLKEYNADRIEATS